MNALKIGAKTVGPGEPTFVIAEIGVNHDGSVERALELVRAAGECGADAVKLQIFRAATLMHGSSLMAGYQKEACGESSAMEMLRQYELESEMLWLVVSEVALRGMVAIATPFSLPDVATVRELELPAVKIASPDLVNYPLLRCAAETGLPLLISTGAATMEEIETSVRWLRQWGASFALLHCVSSYPTPVDQANLCWMEEMSRRFDVAVGFSDHTQEVMSGAMAVAAGARIVEKHLTYDRGATGPDHSASADPGQFAEYVRMIRLAERLNGKPGKRVLDVEQDVRKVSRQSLVAGQDISAGHVIQESDLVVQRPGTGISAGRMPDVVGRKAGRAIKAGEMLAWDMLA